jgi:hypothetical protein
LVQVAMKSITFAESFNPRLAAVPSLCRSSIGIRGLPQSISANSLSAQPARPVHSLALLFSVVEALQCRRQGLPGWESPVDRPRGKVSKRRREISILS